MRTCCDHGRWVLMGAAEVADVLARARFAYSCERDLHLGIEAALRDAGYSPHPEAHLVGGRVDFLVGRCAVEVKVKGSAESLWRQVDRYAADPFVASILVVTTRRSHRVLPRTVGGKPVVVLVVGGLS